MRKTYLYLLWPALMLLVASCSGSGDQGATPDADASIQTPAGEEAEEIAELPRMRVWVDDLRLRNGPGSEAAVVGELAEGTVVEILDESAEQHEANLRGKSIKAPWMKVRQKDGSEGWVFGGALEEMGALGSNASAGIAGYKKYLAGLSAKDCSKLAEAASQLKRDFATADEKTQDNAIRAFYGFYTQAIAAAEQEVFEGPMAADFERLGYENGEPKPKKAEAQLAEWKRCGIDMWYPEGITSPIEEASYMVKNFGTMGSKAMREMLAQRKVELEGGFSADAGLMITPRELAERLVFWDRFEGKYPGFPNLHGDPIDYNWERSVLMTGLDNTPAFDWGGQGKEGEKLYPEWKAAYEWVMEKHRDTRTGKMIKEYYLLLKDAGFVRTRAVSDFSQRWYEENAAN